MRRNQRNQTNFTGAGAGSGDEAPKPDQFYQSLSRSRFIFANLEPKPHLSRIFLATYPCFPANRGAKRITMKDLDKLCKWTKQLRPE